MRKTCLIAALALLVAAPAAANPALENPIGRRPGAGDPNRPDEIIKGDGCTYYPSGMRDCAHVGGTDRVIPAGPDPDHYRYTTSDPALWGRPTGTGTAWTPVDGMLTTRPEGLNAQAAGAEPWSAKRETFDQPTGKRIPRTDGSTTRCKPVNGRMVCR